MVRLATSNHLPQTKDNQSNPRVVLILVNNLLIICETLDICCKPRKGWITSLYRAYVLKELRKADLQNLTVRPYISPDDKCSINYELIESLYPHWTMIHIYGLNALNLQSCKYLRARRVCSRNIGSSRYHFGQTS